MFHMFHDINQPFWGTPMAMETSEPISELLMFRGPPQGQLQEL